MATRETVLVTGAAGFVGSHLSKRLMSEGHAVIGVDAIDDFYDPRMKWANVRDLKEFSKKAKGSFEFFQSDLSDLSVLDSHAFSVVYHLAGRPGVGPSVKEPTVYFQNNVDATVSLLEYCRKRKVFDVVFSSSSSVYGDESPQPFREDAKLERINSPYGVSKRACELLCFSYAHLFQFRFALLRLFSVYGPGQRPDLAIHLFTDRIVKEEPITLFGADGSFRDYTFVDDIVSGIVASRGWLETVAPGTAEIFNLGRGEKVALRDVVSELERATGKKAIVIEKPARPEDVRGTWADTSKGNRVFGYQPIVSLREGISKFVKEFDRRQKDLLLFDEDVDEALIANI